MLHRIHVRWLVPISNLPSSRRLLADAGVYPLLPIGLGYHHNWGCTDTARTPVVCADFLSSNATSVVCLSLRFRLGVWPDVSLLLHPCGGTNYLRPTFHGNFMSMSHHQNHLMASSSTTNSFSLSCALNASSIPHKPKYPPSAAPPACGPRHLPRDRSSVAEPRPAPWLPALPV